MKSVTYGDACSSPVLRSPARASSTERCADLSSSRRIRSAPRASRRRASSAPSAAASPGAPVTRLADHLGRVGAADQPGERQPSLGQRGVTGDRRAAADAQAREQRALGGRRHLGVRHRRARGTASRRARRRRAPPAPARPARSPAACASASSRSAMRAENPRRSSPADASTAASTTPSATLRRRVSTLPRRISIDRSARAARTWQTRRRLDVPTRLPARQRRQPAAVAADDRVARIGARRHGDDRQPGRQLGGHVLHAVHGEIDLAARAGLPRSP